MSAPSRIATLSPSARAALVAVADVLIPAAEGMPSATEAGVPGRLDRVLEIRRGMHRDLHAALAAGQDPEAIVSRLRTEQRRLLTELSEIVAGAYFMDAAVRERLGYPGQTGIGVVAADEDRYTQLVEPVIARGAHYCDPDATRT